MELCKVEVVTGHCILTEVIKLSSFFDSYSVETVNVSIMCHVVSSKPILVRMIKG